jgi:hypothetical protein
MKLWRWDRVIKNNPSCIYIVRMILKPDTTANKEFIAKDAIEHLCKVSPEIKILFAAGDAIYTTGKKSRLSKEKCLKILGWTHTDNARFDRLFANLQTILN